MTQKICLLLYLIFLAWLQFSANDTSFYDKGLIVTDHTIIASKYIANGYYAFSAASLLIVYMQEIS